MEVIIGEEDMMSRYSLEDLLPIVAKLTRKYTSAESTSITYERANQLMEAVLYCIKECERGNILVGKDGIFASEAYQLGYKKVLEKVKRAKENYNEMVLNFCSYGNENYYDTVIKALPAFFRYYDICFAPQENIITMDYPTLRQIQYMSGIDAIDKYIQYICLEQKFMQAFPEKYVCDIFMRFQEDYKKQFYNLCSILLRHVLGCAMIRKKLGTETHEEDYVKLEQIVCIYSKEQLKTVLGRLLEHMLFEKWEMTLEIEDYLKADISNFASDLIMAVENNCLKKIVVL